MVGARGSLSGRARLGNNGNLSALSAASAFSWSAWWTSQNPVQFLDGTVYESEGTYYFRDISGNGIDAEIVDYDFDSSWIGFSYNSAAFIKQPSTGAGYNALYAADTDNFWYSAANTPREIPVSCLFNNIHYDNKIFCKHIPGSYYNGYVKYIITFSAALTEDVLTTANSYFNVPALNANAIWVSKSGSDTTGTGTKAAPYRRMSKAMTQITNGGTIYFGFKSECDPDIVDDFSNTAGKTFTVQGVGYSVMSMRTGSAVPVYTVIIDSNVVFKNLILTNRSAAAVNGGVNHTAGSPEFYLVQLGNTTARNYALTYFGLNIYTQTGGSSKFRATNCLTNINMVSVDDAIIDYQGGFYRGMFQITGASTATIDLSTHGRRVNYNTVKETSTASVRVRRRTMLVNNDMTLSQPSTGLWEVYNTAILNYVQDAGGMAPIILKTGTPTINISDTDAIGYPYIVTSGCSFGSEVNIEDSTLYLDRDNDVAGVHIVEDNVGIHWNIKRSTLEFSGHSGTYLTMGSPVGLSSHTGDTILLIEDCEIIDHINDGIPFGVNYPQCMGIKGSTTIRRTTIKNQNYDGVCNNVCLTITKTTGIPLNVILDDVTFESDVPDGLGCEPIKIIKTAALDANDWIVASGLTNSTLYANIATDMVDYNLLISQAP